MDFTLTEEQQMLRDTVARLVRDSYGFEQREQHRQSAAGYSSALWRQLGELGLTGVPFGEAYGGTGGNGIDVMLVAGELGRGLCLEPYLPSVVHGGGLVAQLGSTAQRQDWLPRIAAAALRVAVATDEAHSHYQLHHVSCRAVPVDGGWRVTGHKAVVFGGHDADLLLVSVRSAGGPRDEHGISLLAIEAGSLGLRRRAYPTVDGRMACDLYLDEVFVPAGALLGQAGQALPALRYQQGRAVAAQCAEAVGSMEEACRLTLDYLKMRRQFGKAIGSFQALQHRMVDMRIALDQATSMAMLAASQADGPDGDERSRALAAAKFLVTGAARKIAEEAIQLHGGIGLTWEYALSHHAKHLMMLGHRYGDDDHHLKTFSGLLQAA